MLVAHFGNLAVHNVDRDMYDRIKAFCSDSIHFDCESVPSGSGFVNLGLLGGWQL